MDCFGEFRVNLVADIFEGAVLRYLRRLVRQSVFSDALFGIPGATRTLPGTNRDSLDLRLLNSVYFDRFAAVVTTRVGWHDR